MSSASRFRSPRLIPGPSSTKWPARTAGSQKKDKTDIVRDDGIQQSTLEYPGLTKEEIYESVERFYSRYFFRPKPILRIVRTMLEDKDVFVRRIREGFEFFRTMSQRRSELRS